MNLMKNLSTFGLRFSQRCTSQDMADQSIRALTSTGGNIVSMGIGNPAFIPEVNRLWRRRMKEIIEKGNTFERVLCQYSTDRGERGFLEAFADILNETYGWSLTHKNIAVTCSSQTACFLLFSLFSGPSPKGTNKVMLPIVPEYSGYGDQAGSEDIFIVEKPEIEFHEERFFKYRMRLPDLESINNLSMIYLSRPTNPSGNVISDDELEKVSDAAKAKGCYLVVDNAYGAPFPNITFTPVNLRFDDHIILTFSLSKIGLPGVSTGIIVAHEEVISRIAILNGVTKLTVPNLGQEMIYPLLEDKSIVPFCNNVIRDFYVRKLQKVQELILHYWKDIEYRLHVCEGGFFVWAWFPGLPISDIELQETLIRENGVCVIPGSYFFRCLPESDPWPHRRECVRISYALDDDLLEKGIKNIATGIKNIMSTKAS